MRRLGLLLISTVLLAGCGAVGPSTTPQNLDLATFARSLPTPKGFSQATDVVRADALQMQTVFAQGTVDRAAASNYTDIGLKDVVIRRWSAPDGGAFTLVVSEWTDHQTAANVGGGAAEVIPLSRGAQAWTPDSLRGARGTRSPSGRPPVTTLSMAIGELDVFIIATGQESTTSVERTMDLARTALGA